MKTQTRSSIREPAVAGVFYPEDPKVLGETIDAFLHAAPFKPLPGRIRGLICPHAGYRFSGAVAACAYKKLLQEQGFDTVVLLAPSHHAFLEGGSVSGASFFRTPLGDVPISTKARDLGKCPPFAIDAPCDVMPPQWARQSVLSGGGTPSADTWEHADEVQVPFLQKTLGDFSLVPVILGEADPAAAAKALAAILDDRTLVVASSDLSHFLPYADAVKRDRKTLDAICSGDLGRITTDDACGAIPIRILLELAKSEGWKAELLDYRNSGDTAGDKSRVVGYGAVAFYAPAENAAGLDESQRKMLLDLARASLRNSAEGNPQLPPDDSPDRMLPRGCFVTLTKNGALRGCIGEIAARQPLCRAVVETCRAAALWDPRFPPVGPDEVDQINIEISVLTEPRPVSFDSPDELLAKIKPHSDGVILRRNSRAATFLPQVWDQVQGKEDFFNHLAIKAGWPPDAWREPGTEVLTYRVEFFKEKAR